MEGDADECYGVIPAVQRKQAIRGMYGINYRECHAKTKRMDGWMEYDSCGMNEG